MKRQRALPQDKSPEKSRDAVGMLLPAVEMLPPSPTLAGAAPAQLQPTPTDLRSSAINPASTSHPSTPTHLALEPRPYVVEASFPPRSGRSSCSSSPPGGCHLTQLAIALISTQTASVQISTPICRDLTAQARHEDCIYPILPLPLISSLPASACR
ncbi:hypothetical protein DFH09DRAFT_1070081 [Mycena vulgaris]|nr:hypothetical protein DFH09DRAFT_1070081 [Mycena vulgaris]